MPVSNFHRNIGTAFALRFPGRVWRLNSLRVLEMIMVPSTILPGTLQKVVHCQLEEGRATAQGYGILIGGNGEYVFFVDSALRDSRLDDLQVGQSVFYSPELGPFGRAFEVWTFSSNAGTRQRGPSLPPGIAEENNHE
jgi:cold shock CspA family protein